MLVHKGSEENISAYPSQEGVIKRNRSLTGMLAFIMFALVILSMCSLTKIGQTNRKLEGISSFWQTTTNKTSPNQRLIVKRCFLWFEAPDKLETWLEMM